ncbi:MAG: transposase [Candidatus Krumholzibacteriia bacterium]
MPLTDVPKVEPTVTQFNVECGTCPKCGRRVQGRHPEQISDALGAAANQIGPNAIALAIELNKSMGVSDGKIAKFFGDTYDLSVHRSTLRRAFLRAARKAEPLYERINIIVRDSGLVYPDETGWKVAGLKEWLWAFVSADATLYAIEPSRGFDVVESVLGADYDGLLGRDGWAPYNRLESAEHQLLLQDSLALRDLRNEGGISRRTFLSRKADLGWRLDDLITKDFSNNENRKLAWHIIDHREHIFTFLEHPELEATNWPAEQAIRPAVVNRKMSGGNRSRDGARSQAILTSVLRRSESSAR